MNHAYKSKSSHIAWEVGTDKPDWVSQMLKDNLLKEDDMGVSINTGDSYVYLNTGDMVVFEVETQKVLCCSNSDFSKLFEQESELKEVNKSFLSVRLTASIIYATMISGYLFSGELTVLYTALVTISTIALLYLMLDLKSIYNFICDIIYGEEDYE